jgi:hypothetical protein
MLRASVAGKVFIGVEGGEHRDKGQRPVQRKSADVGSRGNWGSCVGWEAEQPLCGLCPDDGVYPNHEQP